VILLLHREEYYKGENCPDDLRNVAEVIIAKQRNGPVGTVKLYFSQSLTRFDNLSVGSEPGYVPSAVYNTDGPGLPPEEPAPF
jgi:replicative DNA helicase